MGHSILDAIGNTPLVEIKKLNPNPRIKMLAKLECFNPGGSVKDRAALYMVEAGEKSGELIPQKTVIEPTSGNTGIGLALVCTVKGYRLLLVMSDRQGDCLTLREAVDADWKRSRELGITGVPTFVLGGRGLVGAQPYAQLEAFVAADEDGAPRNLFG